MDVVVGPLLQLSIFHSRSQCSVNLKKTPRILLHTCEWCDYSNVESRPAPVSNMVIHVHN